MREVPAVVAFGAEMRHQKTQNLVLVRFMDGDVNQSTALVGKKFPSIEMFPEAFQGALEEFPVDGEDLSVYQVVSFRATKEIGETVLLGGQTTAAVVFKVSEGTAYARVLANGEARRGQLVRDVKGNPLGKIVSVHSYVLPRGFTAPTSGVMGNRLQPGKFWSPHKKEMGKERIGSLVGWGIGLEGRGREAFFAPYVSVQLTEGKTPRTVQARLAAPYDEENGVDLRTAIHDDGGPGTLPKAFSHMTERIWEFIGADIVVTARAGWYQYEGIAEYGACEGVG